MTDSVTSRVRALAVYEWLRSANPHLPPADRVGSAEGVALTFGPGMVASLTITVQVDLPALPLP